MGLVSMKVLWTLYQSLGGDSATRYHVYYYLVSLANKSLDQEHVQAVSASAVHGTVRSPSRCSHDQPYHQNNWSSHHQSDQIQTQ